jgi:hypothetical protein
MGGKERLAATPRFVGKPWQALVEKALDPFADDSSSHRQAPGNLREGQPIGAQQNDLGALRQPRLDSRRPSPVLQFGSFLWGEENDAWGCTAACHRSILLSLLLQ